MHMRARGICANVRETSGSITRLRLPMFYSSYRISHWQLSIDYFHALILRSLGKKRSCSRNRERIAIQTSLISRCHSIIIWNTQENKTIWLYIPPGGAQDSGGRLRTQNIRHGLSLTHMVYGNRSPLFYARP